MCVNVDFRTSNYIGNVVKEIVEAGLFKHQKLQCGSVMINSF